MGKSSSQLIEKEQELNNTTTTTNEAAKRKRSTMAAESTTAHRRRHPLSEVVSDCIKRWFQDTLKEAKSGDVNMQVLVGQMYYTGYGIAKDANKGRIWITRASRVRSSVWKVSDKRPGYNASDSDSDEVVDEGPPFPQLPDVN